MNPFALLSAGEALESDALEAATLFGLEPIEYPELDQAKSKQLRRFICERMKTAKGRYVLLSSFRLGLELWDMETDLRIRSDFHGATVSYRVEKGGGKGQMIAKAVGLKNEPLHVYDATAGLGGDAFILASLGCRVQMTERQPTVRLLLKSGIAFAKRHAEVTGDDDLLDSLTRMELMPGDSKSFFSAMPAGDRPDAVYLDPMFPKKNKKALVKKEMQVLQGLVGKDPDAAELLDLALQQARKRVVVKRPRIAPRLSDLEPSHVMEGKSNRYDIYMVGA